VITADEKEKLMHDLKSRMSSIVNVADIISSALENSSGDPQFIQLVDKAIEDLSTVWNKIKKEII
jgi:hypothetical protein